MAIAEALTWRHDLAEALGEARRVHRLVLVDFSAAPS
jgi:hypothetical protein